MGWWFCRLKRFSLHFAGSEVDFWILGFNRWHLWVVGRWSDLVHTNARVGSLSEFLTRNTWRFWIGNNFHILVLLIEVLV